jgi:hypothetical protein
VRLEGCLEFLHTEITVYVNFCETQSQAAGEGHFGGCSGGDTLVGYGRGARDAVCVCGRWGAVE